LESNRSLISKFSLKIVEFFAEFLLFFSQNFANFAITLLIFHQISPIVFGIFPKCSIFEMIFLKYSKCAIFFLEYSRKIADFFGKKRDFQDTKLQKE